MTTPALDDLSRERQLLQAFCRLHVPSIEYFSNGPVFLLDTGEPRTRSRKIHHLTSTATCFESLEECPQPFRPKQHVDFVALATQFADGAIALKTDKDAGARGNPEKDSWRSDGSARIYCRCRALPFVVTHLRAWNPKIEEHIATIFHQLTARPERLAIGEADEYGRESDWYPPNAYHTYWTLELLDRIRNLFPTEYARLNQARNLDLHRERMKEWAKQRVGVQVALHSADSSVLDSDQLAWSLAIMLRSPAEYQSKLSHQDFIRQAFRSLFSTQTNVGTWRHYAPLFHYRRSGNAYCFVFETFAVILREALRPEGEFVRATLKEHFPNLIRLWGYAKSTQLPLGGDSRKPGWSSGHRTMTDVNAESWATASVFTYAQSLRRLIGIWSREHALSSLRHFQPYPTVHDAEVDLKQRSAVWRRDSANLADRLWSMFVNPAKLATAAARLDPDLAPLGNNLPRSAILFGPPGTSKTTLAKAIAGCINWDYVELHASDFVAEGLPNVQHTADTIFRKLIELDRAVVLFDEVDELVRERGAETDAFGRFLTTSMLPKLAELWKRRKILYFVATNHIKFFDRAVTRSERFDAVLFISPPSFDTKVRELKRILVEVYGFDTNIRFELQKADVDKAIRLLPPVQADASKEPLPEANRLAKFALLRWDELGELSYRIMQRAPRSGVISNAVLSDALADINDASWRTLDEYHNYIEGEKFERRDLTRQSVWVVDNQTEISALPANVVRANDAAWLTAPVWDPTEIPIEGYGIRQAQPGHVRLLMTPKATGKKAAAKAKKVARSRRAKSNARSSRSRKRRNRRKR